jgi:acyl carrier protein
MTNDEIIQSVKQFILTTFLPGEDPQALTNSTELITGGVLDSLATLELVSFLEEKYGVQFEAHEVDTSHFGTLSAIAELVQSKTAAKR